MIYVFAGVALGLCIAALWDELKPGVSLFPGFDHYYDDDERLGELLELPVPDGWDEDDVVRTLAEISAL
jgi:hypothetical protein